MFTPDPGTTSVFWTDDTTLRKETTVILVLKDHDICTTQRDSVQNINNFAQQTPVAGIHIPEAGNRIYDSGYAREVRGDTPVNYGLYSKVVNDIGVFGPIEPIQMN